MATLKTQKARKDYECSKCKKLIAIGDEYYRYKYNRFSEVRTLHLSCRPSRAQMTSSGFMADIYTYEDETLPNVHFEEPEFIEDAISELIGELEQIRDNEQDKLDNVPENLQDSPNAELFQSRYDSVDEMINELQDIDIEVDTDLTEEETEERLREILEEIRGISYCGE